MAALEFTIDSKFRANVQNARQSGTGLRVRVSEDGEVKAWDEVANYFRDADLTDADITTARDLAAKVRAGTHYVSDYDDHIHPVKAS